jgi:uncharacterized membrane protein
MSELIVIAYPEEDRAEKVMNMMLSLQKDEFISLADAVCVTKDKHEKVQLHQSQHKTGKGAAWGAAAGLIAGSIFLTPLFGVAAGALVGGAAGRRVDIGLPDDFVKQVSAQLKPQSSALVLVVTSINKQVVVPQLQQHGGVLLSSTLSPESEAKLQEALNTSSGGEPPATS